MPDITPFTTNQVYRLNTTTPPEREYNAWGKVNATIAAVNAVADIAGGTSPYVPIAYSGQPTTGQILTIAVSGGETKVFEFVTAEGTVADDAYVGVVIGESADASYANLAAALNGTALANGLEDGDGAQALYNGTQPLKAVQDETNNILYIFEADSLGGTPITGAGSNIAFSTDYSNATLGRANMNLSPSAATNAAATRASRVILAGDLSATQPIQFAVPFLPTGCLLQVFDSGGRLKVGADAKWAAGTAVGGQNFLNVSLNASVSGDPGLLTHETTFTPVASTSVGGLFKGGNRAVSVKTVTAYANTAPAGGTLTYNGVKTTSAGVETTLASLVNIATLSAHVPTSVTYDDAALPQTLAIGDYLLHQAVGGVGLSAPTALTFTTFYSVLVEAGDILVYEVFGA